MAGRVACAQVIFTSGQVAFVLSDQGEGAFVSSTGLLLICTTTLSVVDESDQLNQLSNLTLTSVQIQRSKGT